MGRVKANAWRTVTPSGFVPKQHGHTAVWSPSGIYVVGADLYCYKARITGEFQPLG